MEEWNQAIEAAKLELMLLQAQIETLRARQSMIECIRENFREKPPVTVLKRKVRRKGNTVTILETAFETLREQARSSAWIEQKIMELERIGKHYWQLLNEKEALQAAIQRAEEAEYQCRRLEYELNQLKAQPVQDYDIEDSADREIDYPDATEINYRDY